MGKADPVGIKRKIEGLQDEARGDKSCGDLSLEPGGSGLNSSTRQITGRNPSAE